MKRLLLGVTLCKGGIWMKHTAWKIILSVIVAVASIVLKVVINEEEDHGNHDYEN